MSVSIKNLPIINEINTDDILLVQTPSQTGIIKFQDFVIGPDHVSFYKDIEDIATDVQILSATVAPYTESFGEIVEAGTRSITNSDSISQLTNTLQSIQVQVDQLSTLITALSGEVSLRLDEIDNRMSSVEAKIVTIEEEVGEHSSWIGQQDPQAGL